MAVSSFTQAGDDRPLRPVKDHQEAREDGNWEQVNGILRIAFKLLVNDRGKFTALLSFSSLLGELPSDRPQCLHPGC
jgi:hypothetical protein